MKTLNFRASRRLVLMGALAVFTGAPAISQIPGSEAQAQLRASRSKFTGTVTRDRSGDRFQIRERGSNDLLEVDLVGSAREPQRLSRGDRVEVRGKRTGRRIRATRVRILRDNPGTNPAQNTITGQVMRNFPNDRFQLRTDNGRDYAVQIPNNGPRRISTGDRVQVAGELRGNVFYASSVRFLDNTNNPGNSRVNYTGRVTSVHSRNTLSVRADNGRTYAVSSSDRLPGNLRVGTRVRITGTLNGGVVYVGRVTVI